SQPVRLAVSVSGRLVAVARKGEPIEIRATRDGSLVSTLAVSSDRDPGSHLVRFSPDEELWATGLSTVVVGPVHDPKHEGRLTSFRGNWAIGFTRASKPIVEVTSVLPTETQYEFVERREVAVALRENILERIFGANARWVEGCDSGEAVALLHD